MGKASVISQPTVKPRELNQGGTSTSETVFTSDGTTAVLCRLPSAGQLADANTTTTAMFKVRAWGRVTGGTTTNYEAVLMFGTSTTPGSNTDVETSGAVAVNSESENWAIEVILIWDTTSNKINGRGWGHVGATTAATASITNQITSADPDGNTEQGFVVSGTFSAGNASNVAVLDGFVIEEL